MEFLVLVVSKRNPRAVLDVLTDVGSSLAEAYEYSFRVADRYGVKTEVIRIRRGVTPNAQRCS